RCLQRSVPALTQRSPPERQLPGVVLDHEDLVLDHHWTEGAGSVNEKVLPCPSSLSTQMRPPWSSTRRFDRANPRPVPSRCSLPAAACWNSSKIRALSSAATPGPVSVTEIRSSPSCRAARTATAPPAGGDLAAVEGECMSRFTRQRATTTP